MLEVATEFTFLAPAAYAALRDDFRKEMAEYPPAPPFRVLDTCYNFTGLSRFSVSGVTLKFTGGTELELDVRQMMYFTNPSDMFSVGCLAFAAAPLPAFPVSIIGTLAQMSTEVVYDVRGGRVGFMPGSDDVAPALALASGGVTIPTTGTPVPSARGFHEYTVVVSYGTPAQQLPMALTTGLGISLVRCTTCRSGAPCDDLAFDPSRSSAFTPVPCGSPDCRSSCSGTTSTCPLMVPFLASAVVQGVLTLSPSASVHDFTFGCWTRDATVAPLVNSPALRNHYVVELAGVSLGGRDLPIPPAAVSATNATVLDTALSFTYLKPSVHGLLRDAFRREMALYPPAPPFGGLTGKPEVAL
ncbi:hypothetical protein E2562_033026 [Oryza meyeriana var. granulata]|uniref:Peptidase A1 domain-containing protein n=1 Tax=Oryza meyeriana var. granulata TaxID=110450 RepID=A0A6G1CVZ3_9ORYZ|nr:hypothetical protein E2562_033026 [Oryza meyeriana var. granulata]